MSLALLFHYLMLNMFRMLILPSSGACDLFVELNNEIIKQVTSSRSLFIHIYIYICVCVCVCCAFVGLNNEQYTMHVTYIKIGTDILLNRRVFKI